jgi:hypothetical protein
LPLIAPRMVYLLPLRLDKTAFIATSLVFFAAMHYAKILPYLWLGVFDARNLATCGCSTAWFTACGSLPA